MQGNKTHLLTEHLTDAERKYRRQPREWVAEFVKAGLPEDFADRLVRHLKKGKTNFPCGRACNVLMRLFKLYLVYGIYQALSTRLEYCNVTYQETRKRCEQSIWAKENNQVPNIGTIKGSRTTICLRLTPISETTTDEGVNDESIGNGSQMFALSCAPRHPDESSGTCLASELSKHRSTGVLIRIFRERSCSTANEKGCDTDQKISMLLPGRVY